VHSRQQMMLRTTHSRVSPIKSITQQPLPSSLCSSAVRSELLTCADLLQHLANSIELSGSLAQILRQKVDPTVTCVVLASKPKDRELPADSATESPQRDQCRPVKRCRGDVVSASKGKSSICQHGRQRSKCKDCGGASICQHGRISTQCKECGGASICQHGRIRTQCKQCGGASICQHGRQRSICKECGGASICQHGRIRNVCKECGGASICQHRRVRCRCKECANVYIGRTTAKQLYDHSVCEGTVVGFKAGKYTICYKDNTTSTLTKTALVKTLSPVSAKVTATVAGACHFI